MINSFKISGSSLRVATFNVALDRSVTGILERQLLRGNHLQIKAIAEILQRVRPDVVLLNEFDHDGLGENRRAVRAFLRNYLAQSQNGAEPIEYRWFYIAATNSGELSPFDLDGDGLCQLPTDGYGFGTYHGQYGFIVLSRYPIDYRTIRTFRFLHWNDMPNSLLPSVSSSLSNSAQQGVRLSSKNHIDLPILVQGQRIHLLAAHPTPPIVSTYNIARNHDELRLFADYIAKDPQQSAWIYDDRGRHGGITPNEPFILLGDFNADPYRGDSHPDAIKQLLHHERVDPTAAMSPPSSMGAIAYAKKYPQLSLEQAAHWTHIFPLRLDYVIPSKELPPTASGVYWEPPESPHAYLIHNTQGQQGKEVSSDHRLVWNDFAMT